MTLTDLRRLLPAACIGLAACSSDPSAPPPNNPFKPNQSSERELRLEAEGLYKLARRALESSDFAGAIQRYDQIAARYPFTDYATQADLESIYAKYRSFDPDGAISTADRFLKEHPRHPAVDYVYYLKGLTNFERGESAFDWIVDSTKQDVGFARKAFDDFALMIQRYPASRYAGDARQRMIYLRNRIAGHELHVVHYYVRRGAWLAAAKRAERIVSDYPGSPATMEALELMKKSYQEIGLKQQAEEVEAVLKANPKSAAAPAPRPAQAGAAAAPPAMPAS
ncbi:MAG TPA: outer membrane protein assembly factor BamD [Candidatus Binatia bacterium]|nr:outer membrane protein assembly factor BamD [Candidatus Binatia bacterium]